MKEIKFEKWHGLGNDFIILENDQATSDLAKIMCDRKFGIGADGIFSPKTTNKADIAWDFYNSDGSIAQMCGNGIRCFAKYAYEKKLVKNTKFKVMTLKGIVIPEILDNGEVKVDMGEPVFNPKLIPVNVLDPMNFEIEGFGAGAVSMGNPHCLIYTNENSKELAEKFGRKIETSSLFPEKTNVEFINLINKNEINVNVWERGCGITLACGTGACASVVYGIKRGLLDNIVKVNLPGGSLTIEYFGKSVYMTGSATKVYEGKFFLTQICKD